MKHRKNFFLLLIALIALGGAGVFSWNFSRQASGFSAAEPQSMDSPSSDLAAVTAPESPPEISPIPSVSAASSAGNPAPAASSAPVAPAFIKRTLTEEWIDSPLKLAGRQRIRIVEADFKYPYLRLEESITLDPQTGTEHVTLLRSSVADHLMIGIARGSNLDATRKVLEENGYQIRAVEPDSYILAELEDFTQVSAQSKAIADLQSLNDFIDFAEPDYIVHPCISPNDPAYTSGKLWGLHNPGTTAGSKADADIDAYEAWQVRTDASNIVVAVTDTGIQYNHEDLIGNMWRHPSTNAFGFDAYDDDNDPMDVGGHGTHCAGTIGASGNNAKGMTGVAWNVQLMGVRFLGPNGGSTSDAIRVVNYSRLNGAHIISASWGGGGFSQGLFNAIQACQEADIPFIAAAGNSSTNNDSTPHYPSSYNLPNIVSVASTTNADKLSPFSCYGRYSVDIGAPGSDIWSSYIGSNQTYKYLNGTSMATPHVSGALALAMAHYPDESAEQIIERLYKSADRIPALAGKVSTGARLNLHAMLQTVTPQKSSDLFAEAYRFEGSYGVWSGTSKGATREPDEDAFSVPGSGDNSIWFAFHSGNGGLVTLDAYSNFLGYRMLVFEGSEKGSLQLLHDVTNDFGFLNAGLKFESKPNTEYRIALDDSRPDGQLYSLNYSRIGPNDYFRSATVVSGDSFSVPGTNRGATPEAFEQTRPHAGVGRGKTVWWRWTAPASFDFTINTLGSGFDTVLAVYTGENPYDLTEIGSNDDRNALDWTSQVSFAAVAGITYHIVVDGFRDDAAGEIVLNGFRSGQLTILRQPTSLEAEIGKRAVFDISVQTGGDPQYQWFFNDEAIPGQTSANLVIDPIATTHFGNYKVQVWNSENSLTSQVVTLSEKLTAPQLTWSSGNQAVAPATPVTLSAQFSGSAPITYTWTKNGNPYTGSSSSTNFPAAAIADSGIYRLTATNDAGSAYVDFSLSVVQSPWDRWEWRRPGIPNAAITDIKVYGNEAFAVSATTLLRSTDGVNWRKTIFPDGFTGNSFAIAGSMMLCIGLDSAGQFRIATSTNDGVSWTISATTGHPTILGSEKYSVIGFGGGFISWQGSGQSFFRSTNGSTWTQLNTTNLAGNLVNLTGNGRIVTDGTQLMVASKNVSTNGYLRFHKSTNGSTWAEHETVVPGLTGDTLYTLTAGYGRGRFHLFSTHTIFTSADGVNWDYTAALNNGFSETSMFASTPNTLVSFFQNSQTIRYFSTPTERKLRTIFPSNSHPFTATATFGDKMLFGTDKGLLSLVDDPLDVAIPRERSTTLSSIHFTENLFIARTTNSGSTALQDLVSGDGVTWKLSTLLDNPYVLPTGSASGKYYGYRSFGAAIHSGHNPFDMRLNTSDDIGLAPNITLINQLPNGNTLAISTPDTGSATLNARAAGASAWSTVTFPQTINSGIRFVSLGNRWYSSPESNMFSPADILTSTNGTSWTPSGLTGSYAQFVTMGGKSWCIYLASTGTFPTTVASSTNGTTWTNVAAPTGLPAHSYQKFARRMVAFGDYLVMLGTDENLYYSQNGVNWLRGSVPGKVVDIAAANGQIVAVMKNGGLIQTGSQHAGGSAPLVKIVSPQTGSTHLISSRITIEGTVSDPEDGTASYDCYLDSQLVASGSGNSFRFDVTTTNPSGHTVTVRARDSHGLRQIDAIRLKVAAAELENLFNNIPGGSIAGNHAVTFDGVFYSAGPRTVYRSLDGYKWEKVAIPSFANSIYGMAAGNGSLVIQFDNGGIMTTRDGVNWTHFQPNLTNYWVREPIRFSSGMFIAAYQTQGTTTGSVMTSADGLTWDTGTVSTDGYLSWTANSPDGTIIGAVAYLSGINRTRDSGFNWIPLTSLANGSQFNSHGLFVEGRFLVAITGSPGKLFTSIDTGTWEEQPLPSGIINVPALGHLGGLYFLGRSPNFSHVSHDAVTWQAMSHSVNTRKLVHARGLFLAESSSSGTILSSRDGISWSPIPGLPTTVSRILANEECYVLITTNGAVWNSRDATTWENTALGGAVSTTNNRTARAIAQLNGRIVAGGNRLLSTSGDNGKTWENASINGLPPSSNNGYPKPVSSGSEILVFDGTVSTATSLLRSTDGIAFSTVPGLPAKTWADIAWNGSEWMMIATDGSMFRSTNGGLTWTQLSITGMARGAAVAWFNNRWVVIGAALSGFNTPYVGFSLEAGDVLQNHGNIGFYNSNMPVRTLVAHGRLLIWTQGEKTFVTSSGTSWTAASHSAGAGNHDYDIYHTPDGFTAFKGSTVAYYPVEAWSASPAGLVWSSIPSPFNSIQYAENLGERLFLFTSNNISELHDKDLALILPAMADATLGVGDQINTNVTIRNFGRALSPESTWRVTAWLAKNRFYGDTKNIPLGTFDLTTPMPAPGASADYNVSFALPNELLTGKNYLIFSLSSTSGVLESNASNNTVISDTAAITIPEWEFSVATNGNGQVNRDFAAMRYPHNARVSLTATAGKGAIFTGWAGDAYSPNNQITILMDGNKSLQANFSNRASLQVYVRGFGEVNGVADLGSYELNQNASLTAVPASGWTFSHWSGGSTQTTANTTIVMDQSKAVTAHFVQTLAAWKSSHFNAAQLLDAQISGDDADPDQDGLRNWQEHLHSSHPLNRNSTGVISRELDATFYRCVYQRNTGAPLGSSLLMQAGRNLNDWNSPELEERILSTQNGVETVEARLPRGSHTRGFFRFFYQRAAP